MGCGKDDVHGQLLSKFYHAMYSRNNAPHTGNVDDQQFAKGPEHHKAYNHGAYNDRDIGRFEFRMQQMDLRGQ